jgi:PAS domain S-box-containing protein
LGVDSADLLHAETRNVFFRRISLQDGLPAGTVHQVLQDREGLLWLATQDGLSRYDGYEFTTYRTDPADRNSLPHNDVWSILEDRDGTLWVGTDGGGLSRFDSVTGRFESYRHDPEDPSSLSEDRVRVLRQDAEGFLWIGTYDGGLNRLDRETGTFVRFRAAPLGSSGMSSDRIRDIHPSAAGLLWISTDGGGLNVLDPNTGAVTVLRHDPVERDSLSSDRLGPVGADGDGIIWVGTYDAGLNRIDPESGRVERYLHDPDDPHTLASNYVRALFLDQSDTLWVGTSNGLSQWRPGTGDFSRYVHHPADPLSLSHDRVTSIFQDRGGVLWVGTPRGLNSWNTASGMFLHEFRRTNQPTALSNNFVTSFAEHPDGSIWVGTLGGLNLFQRSTGEFRQIRHDPTDPLSLSDDRVMSLLVDRSGVLWVGTQSAGLNRFDQTSDTFFRYRHDPDDPTSLGGNGITSLLEDRDGTLWVGTFGGGLNRFDVATDSFTRFLSDPGNPRSLSSNRVMAIHQDDDGVLWVATENAGLNRFDRRTGRCRRYVHDPGNQEGLSSNHSWFVTGDDRGDLWIGTDGGGLNQWRADDRAAGRAVFRHYLTIDGLPSSVVYAVIADRQGDIWVSSAGGLSRLAPETGALNNFYSSNGLQSNEFNFAAAFRARDGELFLGGINGFNRFFPERIRPRSYSPPVVLTSFEKFNRAVEFDRPVFEIDDIALGHKDSVIGFHFAALDYAAPDKNRYRFRLEGFDDDWIEAGSTRQATYTNLAAGDYVFRVRGSNSDAIWSENELEVRLGVAPPPWRSWQAYVLYLLGVSTLIAGVSASFVRKRRRAKELERINISLTREIRQREAKEAALEAEKRKAREYLDVAEVIMLAIDPDGRVVLMNQKGCRILGRQENEIVGRIWVDEFVPEGHRAEVRQKLEDVGSYQYYEYPVLAKDGEERVIAWHSANLPASGDDPPVILSSGADTTKVRQLEKQVRFHQKMDALGTLAGGVAHDFNNILTAIFGYSTLTLGQLPPQSEEAGYLNNVVKACERAKDLVGRILTFSRRGEQDKRAIDVGEVVAEAGELLRSSLPATIEVRTSLDAHCLPVMADATQIHQVVMNLGTNAAQAMPRGGLLDITVEMVELSPHKVSGDNLRPGPHVALTVRDTGQGIDSATMEKIFDPFFTTKEIGEGTGLGLSVVHGIIKSHGGDISVTSTEGEGTSFLVHLPCTQIRQSERPARQLSLAGKERILVVDDEPLICDLAIRILESLGYSVTGSTRSSEALQIFLDRPDTFDLVMTDHTMPGITGLELVREMRTVAPDVPVIVMSGRKGDDLDQARDVTFLAKPFSVAEIGGAVRRVLDGGPAHRDSRGVVPRDSVVAR